MTLRRYGNDPSKRKSATNDMRRATGNLQRATSIAPVLRYSNTPERSRSNKDLNIIGSL